MTTPPRRCRLEVERCNSRCTVSTLLNCYPIKFFTSISHDNDCCLVYMSSYGGGLVSGDEAMIDITVHADSALELRTQSSTKVFKRRIGSSVAAPFSQESHVEEGGKEWWLVGDILQRHRLATPMADITQFMLVRVNPGALFRLIPEPVTCFENSSYRQLQHVQLADETASCLLLDWFTSGRASIGESWKFQKYSSTNIVEVMAITTPKTGDVQAKVVIKDSWLLEDDRNDVMLGHLNINNQINNSNDQENSYAHLVKPYHCFGTLISYGPQSQHTTNLILNLFNKLEIKRCGSANNSSATTYTSSSFSKSARSGAPPPCLSSYSPLSPIEYGTDGSPPEFIWSASPVRNGKGCILRACGKETFKLREFFSRFF